MSKNVVVKDLCKVYDGSTELAVSNFNIEIEDGEFIVFVGPSGCGKSTTLRMICGLEEISTGDLFIDGKRVNDLAPKDRDIAMVFQNYALYGHMTVYHNIAFSLVLQKVDSDEIHRRVLDVAEKLGLTPWLNRKPKALSGGQRQRVAVARALVRQPRVYLLDEPLSNLDAKLRGSTRKWLKELHNDIKGTFIYVTHDQIEAMTLADRIVVMSKGIVQQIGTPREVYYTPENLFVAGFMGTPPMNFIKGIVNGNQFKISGSETVVEISAKHAELLANQGYTGKELILGVRPENLHATDEMKNKYSNSVVNFDVLHAEYLGDCNVLNCTVAGNKVNAVLNRTIDIRNLTNVELAIENDYVCFFDIDTELRIR